VVLRWCVEQQVNLRPFGTQGVVELAELILANLLCFLNEGIGVPGKRLQLCSAIR